MSQCADLRELSISTGSIFHSPPSRQESTAAIQPRLIWMQARQVEYLIVDIGHYSSIRNQEVGYPIKISTENSIDFRYCIVRADKIKGSFPAKRVSKRSKYVFFFKPLHYTVRIFTKEWVTQIREKEEVLAALWNHNFHHLRLFQPSINSHQVAPTGPQKQSQQNALTAYSITYVTHHFLQRRTMSPSSASAGSSPSDKLPKFAYATTTTRVSSPPDIVPRISTMTASPPRPRKTIAGFCGNSTRCRLACFIWTIYLSPCTRSRMQNRVSSNRVSRAFPEKIKPPYTTCNPSSSHIASVCSVSRLSDWISLSSSVAGAHRNGACRRFLPFKSKKIRSPGILCMSTWNCAIFSCASRTSLTPSPMIVARMIGSSWALLVDRCCAAEMRFLYALPVQL